MTHQCSTCGNPNSFTQNKSGWHCSICGHPATLKEVRTTPLIVKDGFADGGQYPQPEKGEGRCDGHCCFADVCVCSNHQCWKDGQRKVQPTTQDSGHGLTCKCGSDDCPNTPKNRKVPDVVPFEKVLEDSGREGWEERLDERMDELWNGGENWSDQKRLVIGHVRLLLRTTRKEAHAQGFKDGVLASREAVKSVPSTADCGDEQKVCAWAVLQYLAAIDKLTQ